MRRHREQRPQLIGALASILVGALALVAPAAAQDGTVNDWATFRARLAGCWQAPAGSEGSLIAFRFGLDKTGAMRGKPLVTARQLTGDKETQRLYAEAAVRAWRPACRCRSAQASARSSARARSACASSTRSRPLPIS